MAGIVERSHQMGTPEPSATFTISGPLRRSDLPVLHARACETLGRGARVLYCELRGVEPDAVAVDALGRLALAARRHGCEVRLRGSSEPLRALIALMGLADVLRE